MKNQKDNIVFGKTIDDTSQIINFKSLEVWFFIVFVALCFFGLLFVFYKISIINSEKKLKQSTQKTTFHYSQQIQQTSTKNFETLYI